MQNDKHTHLISLRGDDEDHLKVLPLAEGQIGIFLFLPTPFFAAVEHNLVRRESGVEVQGNVTTFRLSTL